VLFPFWERRKTKDRKGHDVAQVNLRKWWREGSATSKPEPFLQKPQKRFGTPASFSPAWSKVRCRAEGLATRHESVPNLYEDTAGDGPFNAWVDPILTDEWEMIGWLLDDFGLSNNAPID
jgi:hypothetical protein